MSDGQRSEFNERLRRLIKKHRAMSRGYTAHLRPDGLIVLQPKRTQFSISPRSLALFLVAFLAFKGFIIMSLGLATYQDRLSRLEDGTFFERAGAWVMQVDPVSAEIARLIGSLLP